MKGENRSAQSFTSGNDMGASGDSLIFLIGRFEFACTKTQLVQAIFLPFGQSRFINLGVRLVDFYSIFCLLTLEVDLSRSAHLEDDASVDISAVNKLKEDEEIVELQDAADALDQVLEIFLATST